MRNNFSNSAFANALGSLLDLFPSTHYQRYMPRGTAASRIGGHFARAGRHLALRMEHMPVDKHEMEASIRTGDVRRKK